MLKTFFKAIWMFVIIPVLLVISQTLFGAFFGWSVGLFLGKAILGFLEQIGIYGVSMWQFGAVLGFVSAFFKTLITFNDVKKLKS